LGQAWDQVQSFKQLINWLWHWFQDNILTITSAVQLIVLGLAFAGSFAITPTLTNFLNRLFAHARPTGWLARLHAGLQTMIWPLAFFILLSIGAVMTEGTLASSGLVRVALSLVSAWIVIRLISTFLGNAYWSRVLAFIVWVIAALSVLGLLKPTVEVLDQISITIAGTRISAFLVLRGIAVCGVALWAALAGSKLVEVRVQRLPNLTLSARALINQSLKILLLFIALMITMNTIGLDLTTFTVFSGAIGVGIGFGLQKIVANFISGIILLLDRSVRPGDVIEVAGTYGVVREMGGRYASIRTRDGTEHLIPNEEFIIKSVINWSHSDRIIRRRAPVGISYNADVEKAMALVVEGAIGVERVISDPPPLCLLTGFGDSSVNLEVRFWIADPENGLANVTSDVLLNIWNLFHEHGIEIPFPQRDLHLKSTIPLEVSLAKADAGGGSGADR